jgi:hypothetical protein
MLERKALTCLVINVVAASVAGASGFSVTARAESRADPYAGCHGPSAARTPTGRSSGKLGNVAFEAYCRQGRWFVSASMNNVRALPFPLSEAKINGRAPQGGIEILKVLKSPPRRAVALARISAGRNTFDYEIFAIEKGHVVPVRLANSTQPLVLTAGLYVNGGYGFRCTARGNELIAQQYGWGVTPKDVALAAKGLVRVAAERFIIKSSTPARPIGRTSMILSIREAKARSRVSCRGVEDQRLSP